MFDLSFVQNILPFIQNIDFSNPINLLFFAIVIILILIVLIVIAVSLINLVNFFGKIFKGLFISKQAEEIRNAKAARLVYNEGVNLVKKADKPISPLEAKKVQLEKPLEPKSFSITQKNKEVVNIPDSAAVTVNLEAPLVSQNQNSKPLVEPSLNFDKAKVSNVLAGKVISQSANTEPAYKDALSEAGKKNISVMPLKEDVAVAPVVDDTIHVLPIAHSNNLGKESDKSDKIENTDSSILFSHESEVSRIKLEHELRADSKVWQAEKQAGLNLSPLERAELVKEVFSPILGRNISKKDLQVSVKKLNQKLIGTKDSSQHAKIRKEIKFFKKIGGIK